jgi:tetratricopeptide (TPR) repeat protein
MRLLQRQVDANPANVTARRDLARTYLERRLPRRALKLLDEARQRDPESAELLYLTGLARLRAGRAEDALDPLVAAVQKDDRVSFGEAYLVAGDALTQLGRHEEAIDAYERFTETNSSSVQGFIKLALAQRAHGAEGDAKESLQEGLRTFGQLPGYRRRKELGWWLRAQLYRFVV